MEISFIHFVCHFVAWKRFVDSSQQRFDEADCDAKYGTTDGEQFTQRWFVEHVRGLLWITVNANEIC